MSDIVNRVILVSLKALDISINFKLQLSHVLHRKRVKGGVTSRVTSEVKPIAINRLQGK